MNKKNYPRIACIQLDAGSDWKKNWSQAETVVFPENFILRSSDCEMERVAREIVPKIISKLELFSKKNNIAIIAGSVPEFLPRADPKGPCTANTCFVFSRTGKLVLRYRKMHLFDAQLPHVQVRESQSVCPGKKPGYFKIDSISCGVGVCYDLRFPEYFQILSQKGAEIIFIPANFTNETGKTAWEVLLRARAIENQCYVVAAGQCGRHPNSGILSYGNSMIIDPLGRVMKRAPHAKSRVLVAGLDLKVLRSWRKRLPVLEHRKVRLSQA